MGAPRVRTRTTTRGNRTGAEAIVVPSHRVDTIADELESLRRQVTTRAYDLFERRGGAAGRELDDWLSAERETWTPAVALYERDGQFIFQAAVPGVEPDRLDLRVTPDELLIEADVHHEHGADKGTVYLCEFAPGRLVRRVVFPQRIDAARVQATLTHGLLKVTAPLASSSRAVEIGEG